MAWTSTTLNPGSGGDSIATQTNSGVKYQGAVPAWGVDGGPFNVTGLTLGLPVQIVSGSKATYSACVTGLVCAASATDVFVLNGSGSKTVKLLKVIVSGSAGAATFLDYQIIRRSTSDSAGTPASITPVKFLTTDSNATATVASYTANPTTGSSVGIIATQRGALLTSAGNTQVVVFDFQAMGECPTLVATTESFCLNLNGVSITTSALDVTCIFTEE